MSIRHVALLFCMASLFSCSSSPWRAPVSDLTLFANGGTDGAPKEVITETTYRVQKGDTLYSIGWRSGIAVNSLIRHNNLKKPYIIDVGQILRLTN
ncbi:MAG: LysM peptidoglycan-binding domain-containing protein, partial [Psychromonas sp.]